MLVRNIFRPCLALRNTVALTQHISGYYTTHVKKIQDEIKTVPLECTNDLLIEKIDSIIPTKILLTLENNKEMVNGSHIIMALTKFMRLYLNKRSFGNVSKVKDEDFFKQICSIIELNKRKLTSSEIVQILEIFDRMDIPKNLNIIHQLLEHSSKSFNTLSLKEINTLSLLIYKTPEAHKYMNVLKHSFLIKMSMEFNENDISDLSHALSFISCTMVNQPLEYTVIEKLQKYKGDIPLKEAVTIMQSLCHHKYIPIERMDTWSNLYNSTLDVLCEKSEFLNADQVSYLIYITSQMVQIYSKTSENKLYNQKFYEVMVKNIVSKDMGFEKALSALKCLNYIRHESQELLNYCSASYFEKVVMSEENIFDEAGKLLVLIHGLALSKHRTLFWEQIQNYINNNQKKMLSYTHKTLCILAMNLSILDCYPHFMLEKVFDGELDFKSGRFMTWTFCKLYQKLKFDPNYSGPMPTESQLKLLDKIAKETWFREIDYDFLFTEPLKKWLGSEQYLKTNLLTKEFHVIDYLLVFDKNNQPIPFNTSKTSSTQPEYIEDLNISSDHKKVCIIHMPHYWYWKNNKTKILGPYSTIIETLEKMDYTVVNINKSIWKNVPDNEKNIFLMNKVLSKIQGHSNSTTI